MSRIRLKIHNMDIKNKTAVITLIDEDNHKPHPNVFVVTHKKTIDIELNEDGITANTKWLGDYSKSLVFANRLSRIETKEKDIV